jgi:UDP-N-acetylmuramoylalanine--D-glutamate ligase
VQIQNGMQVVVIGLGAAGLSTVRYLLARGAQVKVSDRRTIDQIEPETLDFLRQAAWYNWKPGATPLPFSPMLMW